MRATLVLVLLLSACAKDDAPSWVQQPGTIELTLLPSGEIHRDGKPIGLESIAAWERPADGKPSREPILMNIPSKGPLSILGPLLRALIEKAARVNIGLRPSGSRQPPVYLPVLVAHGCHEVWYFIGPQEHPSHSSFHSEQRLWLRMGANPGGLIRVDAIQIEKVMPTEIEFEVKEGRSAEPTLKDFAWSGSHPPLGVWDSKTIQEFLAREEVKALWPVCILEIRGTDQIEDVLSCLSAIQSAAPSVTADLRLR
jgi:hypothetical protein